MSCSLPQTFLRGQLLTPRFPGLGGSQLHDYLASLLGKTTSGTYFPSGDFQVYKYYAQSMTGHRVGTLPSADKILDTYATVGTDMVRVLTGARIKTGTWQITITNLQAVGLPASGTLSIHTWGFPFTGGHMGDVEKPNDLGNAAHAYTGGSVTFPVYQKDTSTAYAFEFKVGK